MLDNPQQVQKFYLSKFKEFGDTPKGMAWQNEEDHYKRLILAERMLKMACHQEEPRVITPRLPRSILDVGCGYGLLPMLWDVGPKHVRYHGVDLVQEYIDIARHAHYKYEDMTFWCGDFLDYTTIEPFETVVAIGSFAFQPLDTVLQMVRRMWEELYKGGVMLFTFLPDAPLPKATVQWMVKQLGAKGFGWYEGYVGTSEIMVTFRKEE